MFTILSIALLVAIAFSESAIAAPMSIASMKAECQTKKGTMRYNLVSPNGKGVHYKIYCSLPNGLKINPYGGAKYIK